VHVIAREVADGGSVSAICDVSIPGIPCLGSLAAGDFTETSRMARMTRHLRLLGKIGIGGAPAVDTVGVGADIRERPSEPGS